MAIRETVAYEKRRRFWSMEVYSGAYANERDAYLETEDRTRLTQEERDAFDRGELLIARNVFYGFPRRWGESEYDRLAKLIHQEPLLQPLPVRVVSGTAARPRREDEAGETISRG